MRTVAVLDASVLYPPAVRDLLLRLAIAGLYQARWTRQILDECFRAIRRARSDLDSQRLQRTRQLMEDAVLDWEITGYEDRIESLELPDPNDRHVLAAAIEANANVIVTANLRDFPQRSVELYGISSLSPDDFLLGLIEVDYEAVIDVIEEQATALRRPPTTVEGLHQTLAASGLTTSTARLRSLAEEPGRVQRRPTRARCAECDEPVELDDESDPDSWVHAADARDLGDHTAWIDQQ